MAEIIKERQLIENTEYRLEYKDITGMGVFYSFPCDEKGEVITEGECPEALENLRKCQNGIYQVKSPVVKKYTSHYWESAEIECESCSATIDLYDAMTNSCDKCGALYNGSGQRLCDPQFWGEETGESLADILNGREEDW